MKENKIYKIVRWSLLLFPLILLLICCIWYKQIIEGIYIHYDNYNIPINQDLQSLIDNPYKLWLYLFLGGYGNHDKSYLPFFNFFQEMINFFNSKIGSTGVIENSFFNDYLGIPPYVLLPSIYMVYSIFVEIIFIIIDLLTFVLKLFRSTLNRGLRE